LIIEHDGDLRCPPGQGDLMYNALRAAGCEAEMFRIPGWFHTGCYGYRDIEARTERLTAIRAWIESHLPA
jgi:dipeptidyl aminopeptidase/acylaminoacyl peptidase